MSKYVIVKGDKIKLNLIKSFFVSDLKLYIHTIYGFRYSYTFNNKEEIDNVVNTINHFLQKTKNIVKK